VSQFGAVTISIHPAGLAAHFVNPILKIVGCVPNQLTDTDAWDFAAVCEFPELSGRDG
jgi:hypothetical protein